MLEDWETAWQVESAFIAPGFGAEIDQIDCAEIFHDQKDERRCLEDQRDPMQAVVVWTRIPPITPTADTMPALRP